MVINGSDNYRPPVIPFGGVKLSGIGREGLGYTIEELSREKTIVLRRFRDSTGESLLPVSADYQVPAIVSAVKILRELRLRGDDSASAGRPRPRDRALEVERCTTCCRRSSAQRFVIRDGDSRRYRLGPALITLGAAASGQTRLIDIAGARLAPLAAERGLSFAIAQPIGLYEVVIVDRFYPPHGVHVGIRVGSDYGLYEGALGKCLLAALPQEEVERIVKKRSIPAHTDRTLTKPADLLAEVEEVRERGWAASEQELNENNAVAAGRAGSQRQPGTAAARARIRRAARAGRDPGHGRVAGRRRRRDPARGGNRRRRRAPSRRARTGWDSVWFDPPYIVQRVEPRVASRRRAVSNNGEVDLTITGGTVVTPSGQRRVGIAIDDGRIVAIAADEHLPPGARKPRRDRAARPARASSTPRRIRAATCRSPTTWRPSPARRSPPA